MSTYSILLHEIGLDPSEEKWTKAAEIESKFNLAFNSTRLETRRADVLPEAK